MDLVQSVRRLNQPVLATPDWWSPLAWWSPQMIPESVVRYLRAGFLSHSEANHPVRAETTLGLRSSCQQFRQLAD